MIESMGVVRSESLRAEVFHAFDGQSEHIHEAVHSNPQAALSTTLELGEQRRILHAQNFVEFVRSQLLIRFQRLQNELSQFRTGKWNLQCSVLADSLYGKTEIFADLCINSRHTVYAPFYVLL